MIDWGAFLTVAVAALIAASALVVLYAAGVRLMALSHNGSLPRTKRIGAITCWVACAALVLFGIYLIVPALHSG